MGKHWRAELAEVIEFDGSAIVYDRTHVGDSTLNGEPAWPVRTGEDAS